METSLRSVVIDVAKMHHIRKISFNFPCCEKKNECVVRTKRHYSVLISLNNSFFDRQKLSDIVNCDTLFGNRHCSNLLYGYICSKSDSIQQWTSLKYHKTFIKIKEQSASIRKYTSHLYYYPTKYVWQCVSDFDFSYKSTYHTPIHTRGTTPCTTWNISLIFSRICSISM